jgi:L-ascorbate metabolism protein UlaG (beta-lactamase superfamily)
MEVKTKEERNKHGKGNSETGVFALLLPTNYEGPENKPATKITMADTNEYIGMARVISCHWTFTGKLQLDRHARLTCPTSVSIPRA